MSLEIDLALSRPGLTLRAEATLPLSGVTAISGPSGTGKTTLLRAIAGLERMPGRVALAGSVWQDGRRFLPTHRRTLGYVFQEPSLFAHLSVRANLMYGRRRARRPGPDLPEIAALLRLGPLLDRSPAGLSGGERQRVAIGRAIMARPRLLLLDEPLSSLDTAAKAELMPWLRAIATELGVPMLLVSHDADEIRRLATRVVRVAGGGLTAPRPPEEVAALGPPSPGRLRATRLARDGDWLSVAVEGQVLRLCTPLDAPELALAPAEITLAPARTEALVDGQLDGVLAALRPTDDPETLLAEIAIGPQRLCAAIGAAAATLAPGDRVTALLGRIAVSDV